MAPRSITPRFFSTSWIWFMAGLLMFPGNRIPPVEALSQSLCSTQNTGADSQITSDDYQSNGKCSDTCRANYAFAVVQGKNCWCSNYAPADTTSIGSCSSPCPGFPFEQCGSSEYFGYIALDKAPLGTAGVSQSQPSTSSQAQVSTSISQVTLSTPNPVTVQQTVTASPSVKISLVSIIQTPSTTPEVTTETTETTTTPTPAQPTTRYVPVPVTDTTTFSRPSSTSTLSTSLTSPSETAKTSTSPMSTWTPTPIVSVMTVTGQVKTITITPTAPPTASGSAQTKDAGFMSHPGKVAGLFVGVGLIICLIAAALIWLFFRRKRNAEAETIASTTGEETPQRRQSKLSTMGLLGGTKRSNRKSVPRIQTSDWGPGNNMEKSPTDTPIDYRRTSYPRIVDQRLEPTALWNPLQDNGSHVSIQSFRDDQDYSRRMLRVANPDDRPISRDQ